MNENTLMAIKGAIVGALTVIAGEWGWLLWMALLWAILMATDWVVGTHIAKARGEWSSRKHSAGVGHKMGQVLCVSIALSLDLLIHLAMKNIPLVDLPFDYKFLFTPLVILWYIMGELGSLSEHAVTLGAPVPAWLVNMLAVGRHAVDATGNTAVPEISKDKEDNHGTD